MKDRGRRSSWLLLAFVLATTVRADGRAIPPGRQYRLRIEGENTITFVPQVGLDPVKVDYVAKVEYIVDTRFGKEPGKPAEGEAEDRNDEKAVEKPAPKAKAKANAAGRARGKKAEAPPSSRINGAVDLSLHSTEMTLRQAGQAVVETRITRSRFQGRLQPEAPVINVNANEAPPRLQEILKTFDTITATLSINDDHKVIGRRFRHEGPQRALTETILSIHAPIPSGVDAWELPTQLAMGQGNTARGMLRFERAKADPAGPADAGTGRPIQVKVSGTLKAEGVVAGRFIKDGTYKVSGEQTYDMHSNEWVASRWSVVVDNELANQDGQVVAHSRGTMTVRSQAVAAAEVNSGPKL